MVNLMISKANNVLVEASDSNVEKRDELVKCYEYLVSRYKEQKKRDNNDIECISNEELLEKSIEDFVGKMESLKLRLISVGKKDISRECLFILHTMDPGLFILKLRDFEYWMQDLSLREPKFRYVPMNIQEIMEHPHIEDKVESWIDSYEMEVGILESFEKDLVKKYVDVNNERNKKYANIAQLMVVDYICENKKEVDEDVKYEFIKNMSAEEIEDILCNGHISFSNEQIEYLKNNLIKSMSRIDT